MQTHTLNNQALRKLIALLGVDATEALLEEFGGTTVYFPDMERSQRIKGLLEHERHRAEMARASLAGAPDGATQEGVEAIQAEVRLLEALDFAIDAVNGVLISNDMRLIAMERRIDALAKKGGAA